MTRQWILSRTADTLGICRDNHSATTNTQLKTVGGVLRLQEGDMNVGVLGKMVQRLAKLAESVAAKYRRQQGDAGQKTESQSNEQKQVLDGADNPQDIEVLWANCAPLPGRRCARWHRPGSALQSPTVSWGKHKGPGQWRFRESRSKVPWSNRRQNSENFE